MRSISKLGLFAAIALILAACAPAPTPATTAPPTSAPAPAATTAPQPTSAPAATSAPTKEAAPQPVSGGTLVFALSSDAVSLYPHRITELVSGEMTLQMTETLVRLDPNGQAIPNLAKSWKVSDDGKTWTLTLVTGAKFHDGTPFNAQAVKFNLDRILDTNNKLPSRTVIDVVDKVEAKDEATLTITTKVPYSPMLFHLSHYSIGIVSPAAIEKYGNNIDQNPVGTGPFKFVKWTPKESVELARNDDYWGKKPYLDKVIFRSMPEGASRVAAFEKGEVDMIANVPPQEVDRLKTVKGLSVLVAPFNRVMFIHMNNSKKPFSDPKVRQAMNFAVNRQSIVTNIMKNLAIPADGPVASNVFGFSKVGLLNYDVAKAKQLLADAGYPNGFETTIYTPNGRYLGDRETAEAVSGQLAAVGVKAKVQVMDFSAYLTFLAKTPEESQYEMALLGLGPATNETDWVLNGMYNSNSWAPKSNNRSYYKNQSVDTLIAQGQAETDLKKLQQIYADALKQIVTDSPDLWLHELKQVYGIRDNVLGIQTLPVEQIYLDGVSKTK